MREGLALALAADLTAVAAELYQRLALVLYDSADYRRAEEALDTALGLCRVDGDPGTKSACVSCLVYVLRERGEWGRAGELSRDVIDAGSPPGSRRACSARSTASRASSRPRGGCWSPRWRPRSAIGHYHMRIDSIASLAYVAAVEGAHDEAAEHVRKLLERWDASEDHHFAISGLQWASGFLAGRGDRAGAHVCAEALSRIAATTGHPYALAALARAIGECALLDDDAATAAEQLARAAEIHRGLDVPFERAQMELRAAIALAAAGDRETALERLGGAYRTARKLGARPLAAEAATEVAKLGGSVSRRVSEETGLTRRELEVVRLIAVGRTNRDVAQELFLSPRTVDMHVRHILRKLDCHSRVEAAHRAHELGLLA